MAKEDLQYYRWQFLRLNKGYQDLYDLVKRKKPTLCNKVLDLVPVPSAFRQETVLEEIGISHQEGVMINRQWLLMRKYGINGIFNYRRKNPPTSLRIYGPFDAVVMLGTLQPNFSKQFQKGQTIKGPFLYDTFSKKQLAAIAKDNLSKEQGKKFKNKTKEKMEEMLAERMMDLSDKLGLKTTRSAEADVESVRIKSAITVSINCDAKLGDINAQIKAIVDPIQKKRRQFFGMSRPKKTRKADLDQHLKIYNQREKKLRSNKEVAGDKYDLSADSNAGPAITSYHYQEAKKLIKGDYKKILL